MSDEGGVTAAPIKRRPKNRFWRYGPLILWMAAIFFASTDEFSGARTASVIEPFLRWLFPHITRAHLGFFHLLIRKGGHLSEYAILGLLLARAFSASSHLLLRQHWLLLSLFLISLYALSDEFHQRFVPSRSASIYDSLIDIAGGLAALLLFSLWKNVKRRREALVSSSDLRALG
jgi:VanZ family protein